jgi:putative restriction endonuclease
VYLSNLDKYHQPQLSSVEASLLERVATPKPPTDEELATLSDERRHVIREIEHAVRKGRFRRIVLEAYQYKCAVCGLDLGIVHAAHIMPVEEQGTDEAGNGIALCANHHAAFDRDILIIRDDYTALLNPKVKDVRETDFSKLFGEQHKISIPSDARLQPSPEKLRLRMLKHGL